MSAPKPKKRLQKIVPHKGQPEAYTLIFKTAITKDDVERLKDVIRTFFDEK